MHETTKGGERRNYGVFPEHRHWFLNLYHVPVDPKSNRPGTIIIFLFPDSNAQALQTTTKSPIITFGSVNLTHLWFITREPTCLDKEHDFLKAG